MFPAVAPHPHRSPQRRQLWEPSVKRHADTVVFEKLHPVFTETLFPVVIHFIRNQSAHSVN